MAIQKRLSAGEFVIIAEMAPPKGVDISRFVTGAQRIRGRVEAVSVPGLESGVMRLSALGGGALLRQQGFEVLVHVGGRDQNRLALQAELLAAHVLGLENVLVTECEPMEQGDHRDAKPVNDLDVPAHLRAAVGLQRGKDLAGFELEGAPTLFLGCTVRLPRQGRPLDEELKGVASKVEAGAQFVVVPPLFDLDQAKPLLEGLAALKVPVIGTVFLLKSAAVARYIATHEPQSGISEALIQRIRKASDREQECIRIAAESMLALKQRAQGVIIQTLGWENRIPQILDAAAL